MQTNWNDRFAARMARARSSSIREILKLTQHSDIISFAGGLPAPEYFPTQQILRATRRALEQHGSEALQYGVSDGFLPLREMLVRHLVRYGIVCELENLLITTGSQQALDLIGRVLIDPGDTVIVEEPTYLGALQAWSPYGAEYITVPTDDEGMRVDAVADALRATHPKFIYALPNFQNPSGATLSNKRRLELVRLADEYEVPVIEDDPYGQLRYEGKHESSLFALEAYKACLESDGVNFPMARNVIYMSTFSKTLCPGLRVGWVVAHEDVINRMALAKQGTDLHTSTFAQVVAYETARGGFLDRHVRQLRHVYAEKRSTMLAAMQAHFPPGVVWTRPSGGLFIWVTLPKGMDSREVLKQAIEDEVAFVPGCDFYACGGGENTLRLNFSKPTLDEIEVGIKRLGGVIEAAMQRIPASSLKPN